MIRQLFTPLVLVHTLHAAEPPETPLAFAPAVPGASTLPDLGLKVESGPRVPVVSPTALAFDAQGRILVTETHRFGNAVVDNREYPEWYLDDLASRTTADRLALHRKWSERLPPEKLTAKSDLVKLLTDADGDGSPDGSVIFADGFNEPLDGTMAGVFEYEGTAYLACIPKILMLRDSDGDGVADKRVTVADGFGVRISLSGHDLNGFALGPDGRIYATIGDRGFSVTTREGVKLDYPNQGAVLRFDPDGSGLEVFHAGLRNPKEIAFDDSGNPFTVDNNSDQGDQARIVYLVEGGDSGWEMEHQTMFSFHRQIGLENLPPARWMGERMWEPANPQQPAFIIPPCANLTKGPSGLTYHPGTGFLESEAGRFIVCDYRGSAAVSGLWSFGMVPDGAGMKPAAPRQILRGVAATDAEFSPDGRLFVTDFGGGWRSHGGGRLLSLSAGDKAWRAADAKGAARLIAQGFEHRGAAELSFLLRHPDSRVRLRAQLALTRKPEAFVNLSEAAISSDRTVRLHGIWGLGILARRGAAALPFSEFASLPSGKTGAEAEKKLVSLLNDTDAEIRAQVLRALADIPKLTAAVPLGPLLADPSPRVRFFAALVVGRHSLQGYFSQLCDMIAKAENADPYLRHAGAFALGKISSDPSMLRVMTSHPSVAVRLATVVALRRLKSEHLAEFLFDPDPRVTDEAIRAICDLDLAAQRPSVSNLMDDLGARDWSPLMLRRLLHNSFRCGDGENARRLLAFAADAKQPADLRNEAFRLLGDWCEPFPADQFTGHWRPLPKRDPSAILPLFREKLPAMLQPDDLALGGALRLIRRHRIDVPALDAGMLGDFAANSKLPADARATALEMLTELDPAAADKLTTSLLSDPSDSVALTALRRLSVGNDHAVLRAALASGRPPLAREAWKLLAMIPGDETDRMFIEGLDQLRAAKGIGADALELIAAARKRKSPAVAQSLKSLLETLKSDPDPLAAWHPSLEGGDPEAGRKLYVSHPAGECMRCHQLGAGHDTGGITAPNLAGVASRAKDRRYLLESLVNPTAAVAPGFGTVSVSFRNGASISGVQSAATAEHIDLEYNGRLVRVKREDIASAGEPVSAMPSMATHLKPAEIRDLVAWLATLSEPLAETEPPQVPEPLDPSTLAVDAPPASNVDAKVITLGKTQYIVCGACHGQNGEGTPIGPPLAGSEWVNGPAENLIRIQLRGLEGPITVKGVTHDIPGGMAPLAYQNDEQIAAVLTYIRNSFGNSAPAVTASEVAALRSEVGKPKLRATDLVPPVAGAPADKVPAAAKPAPSGKYDNLRHSDGSARLIAAIGTIALIALVAFVLKRKTAN
jgi:quinoprotein glucose dehydrogenase